MQQRNNLVIIKTNVVSSAVRNTSCSRGWLRTFVECMFGIVTVFSFVLIVLLSIKSNNLSSSSRRELCKTQGCSIECDYNSKTYSVDFEDEIISALINIEEDCKYIYLEIDKLRFPNSTIPKKWLSRVQVSVYSLSIMGGNIRHIAPEAFETTLGTSLNRLKFEDVSILGWEPNTLDGLSNLQELIIDDCILKDISRDALDSVTFTLNRLSITNSENWNPRNLTGSSHLPLLQSVKFSHNNFGRILERDTFTQLTHCHILYLDHCKITTIGPHTFDWFKELKFLYLNDNYLVTLPVGLFDNIINIGSHIQSQAVTQINLLDNNWICNCNQTELLRLSAAGLLSTDPLCYYSEGLTMISITQLGISCRNYSSFRAGNQNIYIHANGSCQENVYQLKETQFISPLGSHSCSTWIFPRLSQSIRALSDNKKEVTQRKNNILSPTFALSINQNFMIEVSSNHNNKTQIGFGLVWYQSKCPSEVYCINTLPKYLRLYNMDEQSLYTFCPMQLKTGTVESLQCISYSKDPSHLRSNLIWLFLLSVGIIFLVLGATGVYALIQKYPSLLKGNKRILFVKHKTVDALILPPKVPLRPDLIEENVRNEVKYEKNEIFTVSSSNAVASKDFLRMMSMRSTKSSTPSYISALEPTESQLKEWRLKNLDRLPSDANDEVSLCVSIPSSNYSDSSSIYYSIGEEQYKSTNPTEFNYVRL